MNGFNGSLFGAGKISLVRDPVSMRCGIQKLSLIAAGLGIDIHKGDALVVFFNKSHSIVKLLRADLYGISLIERKLHCGTFAALERRLDEDVGLVPLTRSELIAYLNGSRTISEDYDFWTAENEEERAG